MIKKLAKPRKEDHRVLTKLHSTGTQGKPE